MIEVRVISLAVGMGPIPSAIILKPVAWDGNKDFSEYLLPIWVGTSDAANIVEYFENDERPRPLTHDLTAGMVESLGAQFKWVEINDLKDATFYADICLNTNTGDEMYVDCRPSDAIALATLKDLPIFVDEEVLLEAAIPTSEVLNEKYEFELERFHDFVQNVYPEDFSKNFK